jgi:hypothetical protein
MRENLIKDKNSGGFVGNFGHDMTYAQLRSLYYCPGMRSNMKQFVEK